MLTRVSQTRCSVEGAACLVFNWVLYASMMLQVFESDKSKDLKSLCNLDPRASSRTAVTNLVDRPTKLMLTLT